MIWVVIFIVWFAIGPLIYAGLIVNLKLNEMYIERYGKRYEKRTKTK